MGNIDSEEAFMKAEQTLSEKYQTASIYNPIKIKASLPAGCDKSEIENTLMYNLSKCDTVYMLNGWNDDCLSNRVYGYASAKRLHIWREDNGRYNK